MVERLAMRSAGKRVNYRLLMPCMAEITLCLR